MEDLESRLNSNNPIVIAQIFSKIIRDIKQKAKAEAKESPELRFLREKCISPDPLVSDVAAAGLIKLVEDDVLQIETTMADFITMIPLTKCFSSLTSIIGNLLNLEMKRKLAINKEYRSSYNLSLPQHPYITILIENAEAWSYIIRDIKVFYIKEDRKYLTELFRPVYLYALCNPVQNNTNLLKQKMCTLLLYYNVDINFFYDMLCWLQVETRNNLEVNSEFLNEALSCFLASSEGSVDTEILILWQTSVLYHLAFNRLDIRPCIYSLRNALARKDDLIVVNCLLLMLTKTIEICSSVYLLDLLNLCKDLLLYHGKNIYALESLKTSLLPWLVSPSILTAEATEVANKIFSYIQNYKPVLVDDELLAEFSKKYETVVSANSDVFTNIKISLLLPRFSEENNILEWLEKICNCPLNLIKTMYHFICGLFLAKTSSPSLSQKAFSIISRYVDENKQLSSQLLTLILYKLSNTEDPQLHFTLLKALPRMVVLRENISKVMATIQAVSQGSADLYNFGLSLMFDAWKLEPKCYSYLENMLVQYRAGAERKWETYVTKAFILKELCERKPELYGKDMVAHCSKVLNDCNNDDGSLPSALAIEGITSLCKAEVIDVVTTWATLWPKFKHDRRIPVIKSFCLLIYEIPYLPYTEAYSELREEVVKALWDYVDIGDPQITEAALSSLTSFSFEQICAQLPERYLDENAMQARQKTSMGTPHTVPGHTWVKFLMENEASKETCNFIEKMISTEVSNYLKYVYQVKGTREPVNYGYLPTHSIVRGIGDFVRTWAHRWKNSIHDILYIECLKILSKEYSKPLPPMDWCFLQELIHEPKAKPYCVDIACRQAILSGTARRLIENYVVAVTESPEENDILNILRNLKHLANSIQPIILKPFFEKTVEYATNRYDNEYGEKLLEKISRFLIEVLRNEDIQETNKTTIAQVLSDQISIVDIGSELFEIFSKCIAALPTKCINEITTVKGEVSDEWFAKVTKIRCTAAVQTTVAPLNWLNDIIEASATINRNFGVSNDLVLVFRNHMNNGAECALWPLDLIGQIQAKVADRCEEKEMTYLFDVFILAVAEFSGYSTFVVDQSVNYDVKIKELFPQAFNALLNMDHWCICTNQALEWLYHMNTEETIPIDYRNIFGLALQALRHDDEFKKNFRWMKYLSSKVYHVLP